MKKFKLACLVAALFINSPLCFAGDETYIEVLRHTSSTDEVKTQVLLALQSIPANVRNKVFGNGMRVKVVPQTPDLGKDVLNDRPRGYIRGGGYDSAGGLFIPAENRLVVAELEGYMNSPLKPNARIHSTVPHEFGHAFDFCLGRECEPFSYAYSSSDRFLPIYESESTRMTTTQRTELYYFCQEGAAGASETFAQLFATCCIAESNWNERDRALRAGFPRSLAVVKAVIAKPAVVNE